MWREFGEGGRGWETVASGGCKFCWVVFYGLRWVLDLQRTPSGCHSRVVVRTAG